MDIMVQERGMFHNIKKSTIPKTENPSFAGWIVCFKYICELSALSGLFFLSIKRLKFNVLI
jgi:hypothetical protein